MLICHIPPGNPENAHTISISENALHTHITHHNDYDGPCQPISDPGATACSASGGTSRLEFNVSGTSQVRYSAEALAKLGKTLNTIANASKVVVTRDEVISNYQEGTYRSNSDQPHDPTGGGTQ